MRRRFLLHTVAGGFALGGGPVARGHRMDPRFWSESGALRGAIVSRRNDGTEFPLARVEADDKTLRFQMTAAGGKSQAEVPTMTMTRNAGRWDGYWIRPAGAQLGYPLKLVAAAK